MTLEELSAIFANFTQLRVSPEDSLTNALDLLEAVLEGIETRETRKQAIAARLSIFNRRLATHAQESVNLPAISALKEELANLALYPITRKSLFELLSTNHEISYREQHDIVFATYHFLHLFCSNKLTSHATLSNQHYQRLLIILERLFSKPDVFSVQSIIKFLFSIPTQFIDSGLSNVEVYFNPYSLGAQLIAATMSSASYPLKKYMPVDEAGISKKTIWVYLRIMMLLIDRDDSVTEEVVRHLTVELGRTDYLRELPATELFSYLRDNHTIPTAINNIIPLQVKKAVWEHMTSEPNIEELVKTCHDPKTALGAFFADIINENLDKKISRFQWFNQLTADEQVRRALAVQIRFIAIDAGLFPFREKGKIIELQTIRSQSDLEHSFRAP